MTQEESVKRPVGRPTDYKPEYCQMLIDHMSNGGMIETFGPTIGVCRKTLYTWRIEQPEFLHAFNVGLDLHLQYMMDKASPHLVERFQGPKVNTGLFKLLMANIHGWREKEESKQQEVKPIRVAYVPLSQRKPKE